MTCPECQGQLVHITTSNIWMCEECSYAETTELHNQRLRTGGWPAELRASFFIDERMRENNVWSAAPIETVRNGGTVRFHPEG